MGLKRFFKKVGGWVKDKFHKVKNVVTKFAKPVINVAKKVTDFIGKTPLAPILNTVTGGIYGTVKKGLDLIPDGAVKDNVNKFADEAKARADGAIGRVDQMQHTINTNVDRGKDALNHMGEFAQFVKQNGRKIIEDARQATNRGPVMTKTQPGEFQKYIMNRRPAGLPGVKALVP